MNLKYVKRVLKINKVLANMTISEKKCIFITGLVGVLSD